MTEQLSQYFIEQGVLGVAVILLLAAVGFLVRHVLKSHGRELDEKSEVVRALVESASASMQVARSMEQTNELLRSLLARSGGMSK